MSDKFYKGLKHPIRGKVYENEEIVDIHTFAVNSLKDNKFISTREQDYCIDDFMYFIIPRDTFKDIYEKAYEQGLKAGKKQKIKKEYEVNNIETE